MMWPKLAIWQAVVCLANGSTNRAGGPSVMKSSLVFFSLGWSVLGYWFLDCGENAYSMFSSMTAIATVVFRVDVRIR
jgi:hypothetical protein